MPRHYRPRDPKGNPERLLTAVGKLLREKGHKALSSQQIAWTAKVGKQYITSLFGTRRDLVRVYLEQNDFWLPTLKKLEGESLEGERVLRRFIELLQEQFLYFLEKVELRKFIFWQMSDRDALMRNINELREEEGEKIIALADDHFKDSGVDIHWVIGIALSSGYFYGLHADGGNGPVCGRDVNRPRDVEGAVRTIGQMLELFWWAAEQNKQGKLDPEFFQSFVNKP